MNEFLRRFVMNTIKDMIKENVTEYQVRRYALGWYKEEVITQEDLEEIERLYAEKEVEQEIEEKVVEETEEEAPVESEAE